MKAVPVTNTTSEDMVYKWDGVENKIKAGQTHVMDYGMAYCVARKLANRELNKEGKLASRNNVANKVAEYLDEEPVHESDSSDNFEMEVDKMNQMSKDELVEYAKSKGVNATKNMKEETIKSKLDETTGQETAE